MSNQAEVGALHVSLSADTVQFIEGLSRAQIELGKFGGMLKKFAVAAGVGFTFHEIAKSIQETIGQIDELGHTAQKIGIPVDQLSKLEYAAKLTDVSMDTLQTTIAKFSKSLAEIEGGGKNAAGNALHAIGVSATDAQGRLRPTVDIIADVAGKFSDMRDGANKTAIAMALFGKTGADMVPLLNSGKDAISGAAAELDSFGGVITPQAAEQADKFNTSLTQLTEVGDGLRILIASNLTPVLSDLATNFVEFIKDSDAAKTIWEGLSWVIKNSIQFLEESVAMWQTLAAYVSATSAAYDALLSGNFQGAKDAFTKAGTETAAAWDDANKKFAEYMASLDANSGAGAPGKGDFGLPKLKQDAPVLPSMSGGGGKAARPGTADDIYGKGFTKGIEDAQQQFQDLWDAMSRDVDMQNQLNASSQDLTNAYFGLADAISSDVGDALAVLLSGTMSVKDAFTQLTQSIARDLEQLASQLLKSSIMKLLEYLPGLLAGGGGAGFSLGGMTFGGLYADGGTLGAGQWGIAGEAGPEIIHGPATITPMSKMGGGSVNVNVNNYASASVQTSRRNDGSIEIDIIEKHLATRISRGGNVLSQAIEKGYGLRRSGR